MTTEIKWEKGPAKGGQGTAGTEDGFARWYDGDELMIVVETNHSREIAIVTISCDSEHFSVNDQNGESYYEWSPEDWAYWAKLEDISIPLA